MPVSACACVSVCVSVCVCVCVDRCIDYISFDVNELMSELQNNQNNPGSSILLYVRRARERKQDAFMTGRGASRGLRFCGLRLFWCGFAVLGKHFCGFCAVLRFRKACAVAVSVRKLMRSGGLDVIFIAVLRFH